jgi:WD40 repeat protein
MLTEHTNSVESVAITPDCKLLVSGGLEGEIILWDVQTRDATRPLLSRRSDPASAAKPWINHVPIIIIVAGALER